MSIETVDTVIGDMIKDLQRQYNATGFWSVPSAERKSEIVKEIAALRESMNSKCDCKKV